MLKKTLESPLDYKEKEPVNTKESQHRIFIGRTDTKAEAPLTHIHGIQKDGNDNPMCKTEKETQMYRTDFRTLWEKARVGCFERTASKHVYYLR